MSLANTNLSQTIINGSKKIVLAAALLLTVGVTSSFATPTDGGNDAVTISFRKDFKKAEVIQKEVGKNFTKITFRLNNMVMFAFYNEDGTLLAITRNITSNQLPLQLLMDLKQNYGNYWICDLFEYSGDGNTNYYVTLENADSRVILRSNSTDWEVYDKQVK